MFNYEILLLHIIYIYQNCDKMRWGGIFFFYRKKHKKNEKREKIMLQNIFLSDKNGKKERKVVYKSLKKQNI